MGLVESRGVLIRARERQQLGLAIQRTEKVRLTGVPGPP